MNNPLKYTDPTGFLWKEVKELVKDTWNKVKSFFSRESSDKNGRDRRSDNSSRNRPTRGEIEQPKQELYDGVEKAEVHNNG